ncbi:MAG TPA: putative glycoside hydrolase [Candidatus Aquilonibacter sp.]|nr:putative glycoside hydrolase [Candidatus Aquilonibacter sp.]
MTQRAVCLLAAAGLAACGGGGGAAGSSSNLLPTNATDPGSTSAVTSLATSGTITTTGSIAGTNSTGFVLNTGYPHGKIGIVVTSLTKIVGAKPYVGEEVNVSGSGSWSTNITADSVAQVSATATVVAPTPTPIAIAVPTGVVSTAGTDAGVRTGGFTLNQGYPNGKIPVAVSASTLQIGTPGVGLYAQVTGTGSVHTGITATVITWWPSAPPSVTATGTIVAGTSYGFTLDVDATHTAVPIVLNPSVIIGGGTLQTGSIAQVTGPGGIAEAITPVQIIVTNPTPAPLPNVTASPTPGPIAQKHLLTADYLGGYYGTKSVSWSTAASYLNWASTNQFDANSISAAGIKTMYYTNPNRVQAGDPMYTTDETTFAHDCNGNRITTVFNGITQYVMNVTSPSLATLYHNTISAKISGAHFDAMFEDDAGLLENYGITPLPCSYTDSAWASGASAVGSAAPAPVIFNGLSSLNGHSPSQSVAWVTNPNTLGGNFEHCYSDDAQPKQNGWMWQAVENTELQVAAKHALFICMARNTSDASTQTDARLYTLASFLLTYDPSTSVLWEGFGTPSGLHVMPESQLVVMSPKTSTPSDISGLLTSSGVYGREYNACYIAGQFVGGCAIAVNADPTNSKAFPYPQYTHTLTISGEGIVDGGSIATNGAAAPMYMPATSAVIAFP